MHTYIYTYEFGIFLNLLKYETLHFSKKKTSLSFIIFSIDIEILRWRRNGCFNNKMSL